MDKFDLDATFRKINEKLKLEENRRRQYFYKDKDGIWCCIKRAHGSCNFFISRVSYFPLDKKTTRGEREKKEK
jgi:hypothetical protein